jgi:hypothetical protein
LRKDSALSGRCTAAETVLAGGLSEIGWVLERSASFEASPDGSFVSLGLNFPEIEDLEKYTLAARNAAARLEKIPKKEWVLKGGCQLQVRSILLCIAGEIFCRFPAVRQAAASGRTGRTSPAAGKARSEHIISAVFDCARWAAVNPAAAGPVECAGLFPVRRKIGENSYMAEAAPFRP